MPSERGRDRGQGALPVGTSSIGRNMVFSDYLRMLRRGWALLVIVAVVCLAASAAYLLVTPKRYGSTAQVLVTVQNPQDIADAAQGVQLSSSAADTFADVIETETVLAPASRSLSPSPGVGALRAAIDASQRDGSSVIDITATESDPRTASAEANAVASSAIEVIPSLQGLGVDSPIVLRLIQSAEVPTSPQSPSTKGVLVIGLVLGLLLGIGATVLRQSTDTRLRHLEDLARTSEVPVLALLPRASRGDRSGVMVRDDPAGEAGEAYRSLRTNLARLDRESRRSVLVAPAVDARDSGQVVVNLAWSVAQSGRRVLLIDADLRRSPVADELGLPAAPGLADVLTGERSLDESVRSAGLDGLWVLTSGSPQSNPSDLLSLPGVSRLLEEVEERFDYVFLCVPPLLAYTDAAVVARVAAWTVISVRARQTKSAELQSAMGALASVNVEPLGLVLTGARDSLRVNRGLRSRARPGSDTTSATPGESGRALGVEDEDEDEDELIGEPEEVRRRSTWR